MRKLLIIILVLALNVPIKEVGAAWSYSDIITLIGNKPVIEPRLFMVTGGDALIGVNNIFPESAPESKPIKVIITAYSSTPDQTDNTPFITASNTYVRDGVIAANFLDFGTRVRIPEIFGDKVFTVEDRMARKHSDKIDIWFPERHLAKQFGVQEAEIVILQ